MIGHRGGPAPTPGRPLAVALLAVLLVTAGVPSLVGGQAADDWPQDARLVPDDPVQGEEFGESASLDGDRVLVGAQHGENESGVDTGAAYLFNRSNGTWIQEAKLVPSDGASDDFFGRSVALEGDTAIVGADGHDSDNAPGRGAAYVFTLTGDTWTQQAKLYGDGGVSDSFGSSVALDGDTGLVGAPGAKGFEGRAYVFERSGTTWTPQATLAALDGAREDALGQSVALDGDTAIAGADGADEDRGAAYVFTRDGGSWDQQAELIAPDGAPFDQFGQSVALDQGTALVGAHGNVQQTGAAYAFTRDGGSWTLDAKLTANDGVPGDRFGWATSLHGNTAVVAAPHDSNGNGRDAGAAYAFHRSDGSWIQQTKLTARDGGSDALGFSMAFDGDRALAGAVSAGNSGAAYVYNATPAVPSDSDDGGDRAQNDAGSGGDASDDPDDPTPLPGGEVIHVNGTLIPVQDPIDAYGTPISPNTTVSMRFHFNVPATMGLQLTLLDPGGNEHDSVQAPPQGGEIEVEAVADDGEHLQSGTWVTVLEHGTSDHPATPSVSIPWAAPSAAGPAGSAPPASPMGHVPVDTPVDINVNARGDGVVPDVVPDRFTVIDYRDKRPCNPRC